MKILYSKIANERKKQYKIITKIIEDKGKKVIIKEALTKEAVDHVNNIFEYYNNSNEKNILCKSTKIDEGKIELEFIEGKNLSSRLVEMLVDKQKDRVIYKSVLYKKIISNLFAGADDKYDEIINKKFANSNIDIIFDNIIFNDQEYKVIDYEWVVKEETELGFIVFRAVYAFYITYSDIIEKLFSKEEFFSLFSLEESVLDKYELENNIFNEKVFGKKEGYNNLIKKYEKKSRSLFEPNNQEIYYAQIYFDKGAGFSENLSRTDIVDSKVVDLEYMILPETKTIRIDPLNKPFSCSYFGIYIEKDDELLRVPEEKLEFCERADDKYIFYAEDPQLLIDNSDGRIKKVYLKYIMDTKKSECNDVVKKIIKKYSDMIEISKHELEECKCQFQKNRNQIEEILEENRYIKNLNSNYEKDLLIHKEMEKQLQKRLREINEKYKLLEISNK